MKAGKIESEFETRRSSEVTEQKKQVRDIRFFVRRDK